MIVEWVIKSLLGTNVKSVQLANIPAMEMSRILVRIVRRIHFRILSVRAAAKPAAPDKDRMVSEKVASIISAPAPTGLALREHLRAQRIFTIKKSANNATADTT